MLWVKFVLQHMQISSWLNLNKNVFICWWKTNQFFSYTILISFWYGPNQKKQLKDFFSELNQKHPSIKFDYKFDCKQTESLDNWVYIDQQNKLQTTVFRKSSDHQNFLNVIGTSILIKEKYSQQPSTLNSANMLNIPRIPQPVQKTYAMINNESLYQ